MLLWEPFCCITNVSIDLELQGFIQSPFSDFSFSNVRVFFSLVSSLLYDNKLNIFGFETFETDLVSGKHIFTNNL